MQLNYIPPPPFFKKDTLPQSAEITNDVSTIPRADIQSKNTRSSMQIL